MIGKLADHLPFAGLVDETVMITKDSTLMRVFVIEPRDLSYADDSQIILAVRNLNNALRLISDNGWTIYLDAHSRRDDNVSLYCASEAPAVTRALEASRQRLAPFYRKTFYVTLCKEAPPNTSTIQKLLFKNNSPTERDNIVAALAQFNRTTNDFYNMLAATFNSVHIADSDEMLTYLYSTISSNYQNVLTPELPWYLDEYLASGFMKTDPVTQYIVGPEEEEYICCASIHDWPGETTAGMLSSILSIPAEFRITTRFAFYSRDRARKVIEVARKTQFQKRRGAGAMFQEAVIKQESELQNTQAIALTADASEAMSLLAQGDMTYGLLTTTLITRNRNYALARRTLDDVKAAVNDRNFITKEETLGNFVAFLGSIPGNNEYNPRRFPVSTRNLAHFFLLSVPWQGRPHNEHFAKPEVLGQDAPLMVCKTSYGNGIFYLAPHYMDVMHMMVIGPTGSGKSIFLNAYALFWLKYGRRPLPDELCQVDTKPAPKNPLTKVIFFDKQKSSYYPCTNSGGTFIEINAEPNSLKLNPFSRLESKEDITFTAQLVIEYLRLKNIALAPRDEGLIYQAVEDTAKHDLELRGFESFVGSIMDKDIQAALDTFINGEYAPLFKNGKDDLSFDSRFTTFELDWLMQKDANLVYFVLSYLFHRIESQLELGGVPLALILDEAWLFLANRVFAPKIDDWLRTLRKYNVAVILATQNINDAHRSSIFATILNACFIKILLPNPRALSQDNRPIYADMGLGEGDIYALSNAQPQLDYFYLSPYGKQMFQLGLGPTEIALLKSPFVDKGA